MTELKKCKYLLPCGYCDKYDMPCKTKKCKHHWMLVREYYDANNYKYIYEYVCDKCGETNRAEKRYM